MAQLDGSSIVVVVLKILKQVIDLYAQFFNNKISFFSVISVSYCSLKLIYNNTDLTTVSTTNISFPIIKNFLILPESIQLILKCIYGISRNNSIW